MISMRFYSWMFFHFIDRNNTFPLGGSVDFFFSFFLSNSNTESSLEPLFQQILEPLLGLPGGSNSKESTCNVGDLGSIPRLGKSPGEENDNLLQYSFLENSMNRGTWRAHGFSKRHDWMTNSVSPLLHPIRIISHWTIKVCVGRH